MNLRISTINSFTLVANFPAIWKGQYENLEVIVDYLVDRVSIETDPETEFQIGACRPAITSGSGSSTAAEPSGRSQRLRFSWRRPRVRPVRAPTEARARSRVSSPKRSAIPRRVPARFTAR